MKSSKIAVRKPPKHKSSTSKTRKKSPTDREVPAQPKSFLLAPHGPRVYVVTGKGVRAYHAHVAAPASAQAIAETLGIGSKKLVGAKSNILKLGGAGSLRRLKL